MQGSAWASLEVSLGPEAMSSIWGRRAEKNAEAAKVLAELGGRVLTQEVDVSDEARVVQAMAEAVEEMGRVDGVIANAGMMRNEGSFATMTSDAWHSLLAVNQHGSYYTIREGARAHEASVRRW